MGVERIEGDNEKKGLRYWGKGCRKVGNNGPSAKKSFKAEWTWRLNELTEGAELGASSRI